MRQRELEIRLEQVPAHPRPSPGLEQYRTPPRIAADVLYRALAFGDIADCSVLDLGCGTGMFAIGAMMLGARNALGVDVDEASVEIARKTAAQMGLAAEFLPQDIRTVEGRFDAVLMNPPFGAQFAARHLDVQFLEAAIRCADVSYSLHAAQTAPHLERIARRLGCDQQVLREYRFPLPAQFEFHTREVMEVPVTLHRFERASDAQT
jgi:putative methylase